MSMPFVPVMPTVVGVNGIGQAERNRTAMDFMKSVMIFSSRRAQNSKDLRTERRLELRRAVVEGALTGPSQ